MWTLRGFSIPTFLDWKNEVHVDFWEIEGEWDPTGIPRTFVEKIRSWAHGELELLIQTIENFPTCGIETISISDENMPNDRLLPTPLERIPRTCFVEIP